MDIKIADVLLKKETMPSPAKIELKSPKLRKAALDVAFGKLKSISLCPAITGKLSQTNTSSHDSLPKIEESSTKVAEEALGSLQSDKNKNFSSLPAAKKDVPTRKRKV